MLTLLFLPVMLCYKDKDNLKKFNSRLCRAAYFPICLISATLFTLVNFLMIPLAFIKSLVHKFELWKNHGWATKQRNSFWLFFFLGLPMLLITLFTDLYWFLKHSYSWTVARTQEAASYPKMI